MLDEVITVENEATMLVIGCGKMGGAIVKGWVNNGVKGEKIYIVDPNANSMKALVDDHGINVYLSSEQLPNEVFDYVMVALKPQQIAAFLPSYQTWINEKTTLLSVAAGITSESLHQLLSSVGSVIRVMPNTPSLIQKGVLVAYAPDNASKEVKSYCQGLFQSLGHFYWVDDESHMDAVTAISGSGPAYLFHFVESFINAAKETGLPIELAEDLAVNTIVGASCLVESANSSPSQLRIDVTSPKGTTEAALNVFMQDARLENLVKGAVKAAAERSKELASLF